MSTTLHILNGTNSLSIFNKSGIKGETIAWNEILCEGPTLPEISSEEQRQVRMQFTSSRFSGGDYDEMVWGIWDLLGSGVHFDEIVCWYEYDLFCQINFMAIISWLSKNRPDDQVSIVCSGLDDNGQLKGLGQHQPEDYPKLFENRQPLSDAQKQQALKYWFCYCSSAHDQLLPIAQEADLPYLLESTQAHLRRFPWVGDSLAEHQRQVLSWVDEGITTKHKLVSKFLRTTSYYGFGDLQYFNMIDDMTPWIDWEKGVLNSKGKALLASEGDTGKLPLHQYGGASTMGFRYDPHSKELIAWAQ